MQAAFARGFRDPAVEEEWQRADHRVAMGQQRAQRVGVLDVENFPRNIVAVQQAEHRRVAVADDQLVVAAAAEQLDNGGADLAAAENDDPVHARTPYRKRPS